MLLPYTHSCVRSRPDVCMRIPHEHDSKESMLKLGMRNPYNSMTTQGLKQAPRCPCGSS